MSASAWWSPRGPTSEAEAGRAGEKASSLFRVVKPNDRCKTIAAISGPFMGLLLAVPAPVPQGRDRGYRRNERPVNGPAARFVLVKPAGRPKCGKRRGFWGRIHQIYPHNTAGSLKNSLALRGGGARGEKAGGRGNQMMPSHEIMGT